MVIKGSRGAVPYEEEDMKEGIHPKYTEITVKCLCGKHLSNPVHQVRDIH